MSDTDRAWLDELIARARDMDGVPPFSDGSLLGLASGERELVRRTDAAALVSPTEAEFVVDPPARQHGIGRALLHDLLVAAPGDLLVWSHGDHTAARALAATFGLEPVRRLLQLRGSTGEVSIRPAAYSTTGGEVSIRPAAYSTTGGEVSIRPAAYSTTGGPAAYSTTGDWRDAWVTLNARAFAEHPEQGQVTRADLDELTRESWFDESDVLLARADDELVGYCWLKVDGGSGEIYVVGVAPEWRGRGMGRRLVEAGLARLNGAGIHEVSLYVEGDNLPALALYHSLGFREHSVDIQYRWRSTPDDPVIEPRA